MRIDCLRRDLFQIELRQALLKVAAYPEIGAKAHVRAAASIRTIVLQRTGYVVFYDINLTTSTIEVVRVRHVARSNSSGHVLLIFATTRQL